ncbi:hypothetical protein [Actinomyces wuliandei]|uniref:hypothetical protein n=1 Tax=Actinomyces wuliandei TaxID=2057743 RepID=UPI000FDAE4D3|nr:hypothetical protein [Actinomyces wuliandei]
MSHDSDGVYEAVLRAVGTSSSTASALLRTHQARSARLLQLHTLMPLLLPGIDTITTLLAFLTRETPSQALGALLDRASREALRGTEGVLADDQQTINDAARLLMEIEVLLQEWAYDPDRAAQWQDTPEEERHRVFGFGKVLQRIKHHQGVDDNLVMPQWQEYHVHSMMLHPTPRHTQEVVLVDLVWQTSEVLIHLERVKKAALTLTLSDDTRFAVDPDTLPDAWQPELWNDVYNHFLTLRDQARDEALAKHGMVWTPRQPHPKGQPRIVPAPSPEEQPRHTS